MCSVLRRGDKGAEVVHLQKALNTYLRPCPNLKIDGIFGPHTESAVLLYQKNIGLVADGIVGHLSWSALEAVGTQKSVPNSHLPPSFTAPWMTIAAREIGQKEHPKDRHNLRILEYHASTSLRATADEVAWCSAFVNWCLKQAGFHGTNSAAASSWLHWGRTSSPVPGAVSVVQRNTGQKHVAFWVSQERDHFTLLGGNQSHQVRMSIFPKSSYMILGHRWPDNESK